MRLERPIPIPELWPDVPARLAAQVERYLDRTLRIEILLIEHGGWERINVITMDDVPAKHEDVSALAKACADAHAMERGRSGKYRAVMVRDVGELDYRKATFPVDLEAEARRLLSHRRRSKNGWVELVDAWHRLAQLMVGYNERAMERLLEQQRIRQEADEQQLQVLLREMVALYEEGLQMKAAAAREVTEQRVQERLAQARAQVDARVWETFAPILEMAVARLGEMFEQQRGADGDAPEGEREAAAAETAGAELEVAGESEGEREEGAPPVAGADPSSGKASSGA